VDSANGATKVLKQERVKMTTIEQCLARADEADEKIAR
jgi:hypothetical protein